MVFYFLTTDPMGLKFNFCKNSNETKYFIAFSNLYFSGTAIWLTVGVVLSFARKEFYKLTQKQQNIAKNLWENKGRS